MDCFDGQIFDSVIFDTGDAATVSLGRHRHQRRRLSVQELKDLDRQWLGLTAPPVLAPPQAAAPIFVPPAEPVPLVRTTATYPWADFGFQVAARISHESSAEIEAEVDFDAHAVELERHVSTELPELSASVTTAVEAGREALATVGFAVRAVIRADPWRDRPISREEARKALQAMAV